MGHVIIGEVWAEWISYTNIISLGVNVTIMVIRMGLWLSMHIVIFWFNGWQWDRIIIVHRIEGNVNSLIDGDICE